MMSQPPLLLLVEDHPPTAEVTREILETFGYRVALATNGAEAVAEARAQRPAMVLMDVHMPVKDGLAATRELRASGDTAALPIYCLTAFAMPEEAARCHAAGATGVLTKPLDFDRLAGVLASMLPVGTA